MNDPSRGIARELIPHVHLLSTYRFPILQQLHHDKVAQWLMGAPKIARDQAGFYWTYFDRPVDGTIYLVWQSPALGNEYPSDGYVWAPGETTHQMEINGGYVLEMHNAKAGFAQGDHFATHARRRYRLLPSRTPTSNSPTVDPKMWIIHYCQAAPDDRVPTSMIPIDMRIQNMLNTRSYLKSQGQIAQKEFMLGDHTNYPQIPFPRGQHRPSMYGGNMPPARLPQNMAYPTQSISGPPSKRARTDDGGSMSIPAGAHPLLGEDDEEDTSRGDLWDMILPREISEARYVQNHLWMEEVVSSQYPINRIVPSDLGLGLCGQLGSLTDDIFDAPFAPYDDTADKPKNVYVGRLDSGKADEFRKRVSEHLENTNKEIEKMKAKHAKHLAKFKLGNTINRAELELRTAVADPLDIGPEYWRLEGKIDTDELGDEKTPPKTAEKVADLLAQVEASLGRHASAVQELRRIQDGGFEETVAVHTPQISRQASRSGSHRSGSGVLVGDADLDMGNSTAGLLDQFQSGLSSTHTPGSNMQTTQAHLTGLSAASTSSALNVASPQPPQTSEHRDVNMSDASTHNPPPSATGTSISAPGSDWVVVPPGGASPDSAMPSCTQPGASASGTSPMPPSTANAPLPDFTAPEQDDHHNDFSDLADLDTAGDALANFDTPPTDTGATTTQIGTADQAETGPAIATPGDAGLGDLDLQMDGMDADLEMGDMGDLNMEIGNMEGMGDDSAFGEAFVGVGEGDGGVEGGGEGEVA